MPTLTKEHLALRGLALTGQCFAGPGEVPVSVTPPGSEDSETGDDAVLVIEYRSCFTRIKKGCKRKRERVTRDRMVIAVPKIIADGDDFRWMARSVIVFENGKVTRTVNY